MQFFCHLTLVSMTIINKSKNKCWRECEEKGTLLHYLWECKLVQPLWKTVWRFLQKLKMELPYPFGYISKGIQNSNLKKYMHAYVHCNILYHSQAMEATQMLTSILVDKKLWYIQTVFIKKIDIVLTGLAQWMQGTLA